jgi:hypothetical protein
MVGTVTVTEEKADSSLDKSKSYHKIQWTWAADASGDADLVTTDKYTGNVFLCITNPDADAPTDDYDIVINDDDGTDVLNGDGANRDTANTEQIVAFGFVHNSTLDLIVSNAGNANDGVVTLFIGP